MRHPARRRFVIEIPVETPDGFGGVLRRHVAGPVLSGAIRPAAGAESAVTHHVTCRPPRGLTPAMRLAAGSRRFAIRAVRPGADGAVLCEVAEIVAARGAGAFR